MKKIFTLIAIAAAALTASAQDSIELLFGPNHTVVQPGQTYETGYTVDASGFVYKQDAELFIRCEEGYDITVEVKASEVVQVCSVDGQCSNGCDVTKTGNSAMIPDGDKTVDGDFVTADLRIDKQNISIDGSVPAMSDITVEVTAYYTDEPDNKVTAKVIMTNKPASEIGGISAVALDTYFVKAMNGNVINYNVERPSTISIYAITGNQVASYNINGRGSINLSGLRKGIYLYSDGRRSGKMTIR